MIYECHQCQTPQYAGTRVCPQCGNRFEGPVPSDAVVPEQPAPQQQAMPDLSAPMPPPAWSGPTIPPVPDPFASRPLPPVRQTASRPLLILGAVVLAIALLAGGYALWSSQQGLQNPPSTAVAAAPVPAFGTPESNPAPVTLPATMQTGSTNAAAEAPPIGRWMSKDFDFYEFDQSGSGSRGSANTPTTDQAFHWTVQKNDLILSLGQNSGMQKIPYNYGPSGSTLYLRQPNGHYQEYTQQEGAQQ